MPYEEVQNIEEFVIDGGAMCEVTNINSLYFGKDFYVTHAAFAAGKEWFKSAYPVANGVFVWFSRNELEFEQEYYMGIIWVFQN